MNDHASTSRVCSENDVSKNTIKYIEPYYSVIKNQIDKIYTILLDRIKQIIQTIIKLIDRIKAAENNINLNRVAGQFNKHYEQIGRRK